MLPTRTVNEAQTPAAAWGPHTAAVAQFNTGSSLTPSAQTTALSLSDDLSQDIWLKSAFCLGKWKRGQRDGAEGLKVISQSIPF